MYSGWKRSYSAQSVVEVLAGTDSVAGIVAEAVGFVVQEEMPATDFAAHLAVLDDSVGTGALG